MPLPELAQAQDDATVLRSRAGRGGPRHHHRRRDPPRKLFQPLRHRARGRRHRQSRHGARSHRPSESGAAHHRQDPAPAPGGGGRSRLSGAHTRKPVKMTVPGPFTMSQQAQNDLRRRGRSGDGLRRRGERGDPGSLRGRRRHRADRRAVHAGSAGKARDYGLKALNRALEGVTGTTAVHICFGYAAIVHEQPSGLLLLAELAGCACRQVSIETAQSKLDCEVLAVSTARRSWSACIDLATWPWSRPRRSPERIRARCPMYRRSGHPRAGLRHEVPAARGRVRQDAGDGRRRVACAPGKSSSSPGRSCRRLRAP